MNPKFDHNVGAVQRAASCYGVGQVWWSGSRVTLAGGSSKRRRLPREERMRGYQDVQLFESDRFFDAFKGAVPVAIELVPGAVPLMDFVHPESALYVFGPEDGSLDRSALGQCHQFVSIPSRHCLNLAAAVYTVLYDRHCKRVQSGLEAPHSTGSRVFQEDRVPEFVQ